MKLIVASRVQGFLAFLIYVVITETFKDNPLLNLYAVDLSHLFNFFHPYYNTRTCILDIMCFDYIFMLHLPHNNENEYQWNCVDHL